MFGLHGKASRDSTEWELVEALMGEKELFEGLPLMAAPKEEQVGRPQLPSLNGARWSGGRWTSTV